MIDLQRFRKEKGISQKELQKILNLSQGYISTIEHKVKPVTQDILDKLVKHYGDDVLLYKTNISDIGNKSDLGIKVNKHVSQITDKTEMLEKLLIEKDKRIEEITELKDNYKSQVDKLKKEIESLKKQSTKQTTN